jgi:ferrous iron transport protein A
MLTPSSDPPPQPAVVPLCELRPGATAVVDCVEGDPAVGQRLLDLGFTPGTVVMVVRRAPLGDPIVYELRGYRIALRRSEGRLVRVRPA